METQKHDLNSATYLRSQEKTPLKDPKVVDFGSFFLGYVIGSKRLPDFGRKLAKIAESLGSLALLNLTQSIKEKNPKVFQSQ